jgi:hypothetical protein
MEKIVAQFNIDGFTIEQYRELINSLGTSGKEKSSSRLNQLVVQQNGGIIIIDVWESEEALNKFVAILLPVLEKNGVKPPIPVLIPLHNFMNK